MVVEAAGQAAVDGPVVAEEALVDLAEEAVEAAAPVAVGKMNLYERICDRCFQDRRVANAER